ncbi:50S ribosomal protein L9 [Pelolinea submarina]|uniref:Large ribosomal subunit protein bL9 n=1 Tax=Pelolinea submarina TaxID=913107 RepID=A0A347ZVR9_9CHLR|nr:50S ribosomal protein L9 [Pelolinea submarina]REG07096.1 large subunit ribosomal protein L9 [Pelolinea submarina]BBB49400.1 large subunit ribosomal protein L9 [Pelolinea submarina]
MKVMLMKDVYNLGRAGEVKKVADGYARNFLIPQRLAVPASVGALRQIEKIQAAAAKQREMLNEEMSGLAEQIKALELTFKAKVGETGKLYGSITQQAIIDAVNEKLNSNLDRHLLESEPLREVGEHMVRIRLTFDLVPELKVIIESDEEKKEDKAPGRKSTKRVEETPEEQPEAAVEVEEVVAESVEETETDTPAEEEA